MEHLVSGIARINFQQNCEDSLLVNCVDRMANWPASELVSGATGDVPNVKCELNSSNESGEYAQDVENEADDVPGCSNAGIAARCAQRRNLPQRACKENTHKVKRRSIIKPKRNAAKTSDFSLLRPADIKKIYTNQKLTNFRPTNLETIFEEPQPERRSGGAAANATDAAEGSQLRFIGMRKVRRSLSCSDGLNINKTLTKQRRARIKKVFGRRCALKKISLTDFLERLNKSFDSVTDTEPESELAQLDEPMEADAEVHYTANTKKTGLLQLEEAAVTDLQDAGEHIEDSQMLFKSNSYSGVCFTARHVEASTTGNANCMGGIALS